MAFKIAGVQMDVLLGETRHNLERMVSFLEQTAKEGADLTIFPECALSGYCFESLDEARLFAETLPGPTTATLTEQCAQFGAHIIFGLLESDGDRVFNACALVGPDGLVASYRKVHLPHLGVDRFVDPGNRPFSVESLGDVRLAMNICYDSAFPEAARAVALDGADLIVLPTNWAVGAEKTPAYVINARALENAVYYAAVNRVGTEQGFRFIGNSKICAPDGSTISEAAHERETILHASVEVERARCKHQVRVPGEYEIDRFGDRRPAMYSRVVQPVEPDTDVDERSA